MESIKNMHRMLNERLTITKSRMEAIAREQATLSQEIEHLQGLVKHYGTMEYDSIEEERRVTEHIIHLPLVANRGTSKPAALADGELADTLLNIFSESSETIKFNEICRRASGRAGREVDKATINKWLRKLSPLIERVGYGRYAQGRQ